MRSYELVFIVRPEIDGDDLTAVIETVTNLVERGGGKVAQIKPWGLRRLAYPIRDQWEGQYVLMRLELNPQGVTALERGLGLIEQILRHLVVRVEEAEQEREAEAPEPVAEQDTEQDSRASRS